MSDSFKALQIVPVLSSSDIERDLKWYDNYVGFKYIFGNNDYAGLKREDLEFHLQFHHGTTDDPVNAGVMKIFVSDIHQYFEEFLKRKTVTKEKLITNTPWGTHEFGFYDLNNNAIFFVQDV